MWDFIVRYWMEFAFGLVTAILSAAYAHLAKRFKAEKKKNEAIENGLRGILRIQILDTYDKCVADGNRISVSRKDAVVSIYNSYIALGNGESDDTINDLYTQIIHMTIS
jgi:hypothetical protein